MRSIFLGRFIIIIASALLIGCTDDNLTDSENCGGGGGENPGISQYQTQVESITNLYISSNAEAYASLEVRFPFIAAYLGTMSIQTIQQSARLTITCFSGVAGTTYLFNGAS